MNMKMMKVRGVIVLMKVRAYKRHMSKIYSSGFLVFFSILNEKCKNRKKTEKKPTKKKNKNIYKKKMK